MASFVVVLDACVIIPAVLRDTLFRADQAHLYRMQFTDMILEEVQRNLVENGMMNTAQAQHLIDTINAKLALALIKKDYRQLIPDMTNHPKDRHVLAAAVVSDAEVIVTANLRDFPTSALAAYNIEAQSPDQFLTHLFYRDTPKMAQIMKQQAKRLQNPPLTVTDILNGLRTHAPQFVSLIAEHVDDDPDV